MSFRPKRSDFVSRFMRNKLALSGLVIVLFFFIVSLAAPIIERYDPSEINKKEILLAPDSKHIFGTDKLGRDVFARMVWGSRISLKVGFIAVGISILIGTFLGAVAGFYRGAIDAENYELAAILRDELRMMQE